MRRTLVMRLVAALSGLLAACDDGATVTRVDRMGGFSRSWIVSAAAGGGLPVEIHGAPFPGFTAEEAAAGLSFPPGTLHDVRFRLARPGEAPVNRLILVFNRADAPDAARDCRREDPPPTRAAAVDRFTAQATFCMGGRLQATGVLEARVEAGDREGYARAMRRLLREIAGDIVI